MMSSPAFIEIEPPTSFPECVIERVLVMPETTVQRTVYMVAGKGTGIRYMTPVGPVGLLYGYKLNPEEGEDTSRFHLSIFYRVSKVPS